MGEERLGLAAFLDEKIAELTISLIEGFKHEPVPKLEVYRDVVGESLLHPQDAHVVALASDQRVQTRLPQFRLDDAAGIAEFIINFSAT